MNKVITYEDFKKLFQQTDDPDKYTIFGNEFNNFERSQALDSYCMLRDTGVFSLPLSYMIEFVADPAVKPNVGFKLVLCFVLPENEIIRLLLVDNDKRLINVINRRLECDNHKVPYDCTLFFK